MQQRQLTDQPAAPTGAVGLAVRVFWMAFGNAGLLLLAVSIAQRGAVSRLDVGFWTLAAALLLVRYLDITRLSGLTADGKPASLGHWRRYAIGLLGASVILWALAHAVARLLAG